MDNPVIAALLNPPPTLRGLLAGLTAEEVDLSGKVVVLTGASSGIGEAAAHLLADRGATVVAVARDHDRLSAVCDAIAARGRDAVPLSCDLTDADDVTRLATTVLDKFGAPDIVVNNAGRSIRRSALDATDRFHDYERTMAVNYFGPVRLILALLPALRDAGGGHIVNVSTWGTTAGTMPKFTAYHASKAAVAAFGRSLDAECHGTGIAVTTVGFPLVRTPMISPTADYDRQPALTPERAAEWILTAIRDRPVELFPTYAAVLRLVSGVAPRLADSLIRRSGI